MFDELEESVAGTGRMIGRIAVLLGVLAVALGIAPARAGTLTLVVDNVQTSDGAIMVSVGPAEAFAGTVAHPLQVILPARAGQVTFTTDALAAGTYAAQVMHDVNGNGQLDTNLVGMPREPWGMSNDARGNFGPPEFDDMRFELGADTVITIRLEQ